MFIFTPIYIHIPWAGKVKIIRCIKLCLSTLQNNLPAINLLERDKFIITFAYVIIIRIGNSSLDNEHNIKKFLLKLVVPIASVNFGLRTYV